MPPSLGGMPAEIMQKILKELAVEHTFESRESLKSLRLAGDQRLVLPAAVFLYHTVSFWFGPKSLRNISSLSECRHL